MSLSRLAGGICRCASVSARTCPVKTSISRVDGGPGGPAGPRSTAGGAAASSDAPTRGAAPAGGKSSARHTPTQRHRTAAPIRRSEEHTSELQSRLHLVCRLLLEKKKKQTTYTAHTALV